MSKHVHLRMGVNSPKRSKKELEKEEEVIIATVLKYLPEVKDMLKRYRDGEMDIVMLHQDAFAAGYHMDEYTLLGMVIKYFGIYGVTVMVNGKNGETFKSSNK